MKNIIRKIFPKGKKKKKKKISIILLAVFVCLAAAVGAYKYKDAKAASAASGSVKTAIVTKQDITSQLSSSGTIEAKATYDITSLAEGEVTASDFEAGDQVEKGQVLYQIDASSMTSQITSVNNSLERARENYNDALEDYNTALSDYSGNTYKSTKDGFIKTLSINEGDKVSDKTELAAIYNDQLMTIKVPFLSGEAAEIGVGSTAVLALTDTGEELSGTVSSVSNMDVTLTGGRIVRYVTVEVSNPGGLTTDMAATAAVGDFACAAEAVFEPKVETTMSAELNAGVEVGTLLVHEGDYVTKGTPLFVMESKSAEDLIKTYKDDLNDAETALENAKTKQESTQDTYDNYTITAPISGQVISKTVKAGDNITDTGTALAVIYDMSSYTFEMSVDELDVKSVKVGQNVIITADAVSGRTFSGTVTNVSLESTTSDGVTNYPVTVTMNDGMDSLLPGMNVDGVIILDDVKDALAVPADSLMRGNTVYVQDDTVKEADGEVPAGFKAVEVTTGLISEDYVEITSGLEENQVVYVADTTVSSTTNVRMPGMEGMPGGQGGNRSGGMSGGQGGGSWGGNRGGSRSTGQGGGSR